MCPGFRSSPAACTSRRAASPWTITTTVRVCADGVVWPLYSAWRARIRRGGDFRTCGSQLWRMRCDCLLECVWMPSPINAGDPCSGTYKWLTVQMTCTYCDPNSVTTGADQWSNLRQSGWAMYADWTCAPGYYLASAVPVTKGCNMDVGSFGSAGIGCNACGTGYYCPGGSANSRTACPAGTYGRPLDVTLTSASCSGQCQAGFFCPSGSTTPTAQSWCVASAGHACDATPRCRSATQ
jgi:hypothetical protein